METKKNSELNNDGYAYDKTDLTLDFRVVVTREVQSKYVTTLPPNGHKCNNRTSKREQLFNAQNLDLTDYLNVTNNIINAAILQLKSIINYNCYVIIYIYILQSKSCGEK